MASYIAAKKPFLTHLQLAVKRASPASSPQPVSVHRIATHTPEPRLTIGRPVGTGDATAEHHKQGHGDELGDGRLHVDDDATFFVLLRMEHANPNLRHLRPRHGRRFGPGTGCLTSTFGHVSDGSSGAMHCSQEAGPGHLLTLKSVQGHVTTEAEDICMRGLGGGQGRGQESTNIGHQMPAQELRSPLGDVLDRCRNI